MNKSLADMVAWFSKFAEKDSVKPETERAMTEAEKEHLTARLDEITRKEMQRMYEAPTALVEEDGTFDAKKMKEAIATIVASELRDRESKGIKEFREQYETTPIKPEVRLFKFIGKMDWAWEVENSCDSDEINDLLSGFKKANNLGSKMAHALFKEVAERASKGPANESYIDEDGTNLILPNVPYSPYTDEGAAFFVSLTYAWRAMAQEWNAQEDDRKKAEAEKQQREMADYMAEQTQKMIEKMAEESAIKRDDKIDASAFFKMAQPLRPELLGSSIVNIPESTGVSKIAAGLSMGQLKKSKF